jgi:hypothetical protein
VARPRKLFRLSLRALLLLVALACVWMAIESSQARAQKRTVQWVIQNGGKVRYDWQYRRQGKPLVEPTPPGPRWLRRLIGDDYFQTVTHVWLRNAKIRDLQWVRSLPEVRMVHLGDNEINDISPLAGLKNLRDVYLPANQIEDLLPLEGLSKLEWVDVTSNRISDLRPLHSSPKLLGLRIINNPIPDEQLKAFRQARPELRYGVINDKPQSARD